MLYSVQRSQYQKSKSKTTARILTIIRQCLLDTSSVYSIYVHKYAGRPIPERKTAAPLESGLPPLKDQAPQGSPPSFKGFLTDKDKLRQNAVLNTADIWKPKLPQGSPHPNQFGKLGVSGLVVRASGNLNSWLAAACTVCSMFDKRGS